MLGGLVCGGVVLRSGIANAVWAYELLLRIKHRFGVSAESFVIRLEELDPIASELAVDFKRRIREHYAETGFKEPDSSSRIFSPNGRLGDLCLNARGRMDESECALCTELLARHKVKVG